MRGCVPTVSGRWLRVEGMEVDLDGADVGVVLQPATVEQLLGTVAAYHGLTRRELEILDLVVRGLPSKHVARELGISLLTVNGHLKAVYRKCRVAGRDELVGRLVLPVVSAAPAAGRTPRARSAGRLPPWGSRAAPLSRRAGRHRSAPR